MHRRAAKVDSNQSLVVKELRARGYTVQSLASIGKGCPDLVIGKDGINYLIEIKDPAKPASGRKLTDDQVTWHNNWQGQVAVIETSEQALTYFTETK